VEIRTAKKRLQARGKRRFSIRKKINGTSECPRLAIFRSHKNIFAQVIDDVTGNTLFAVSTLTPALQDLLQDKKKVEKAWAAGEFLGNACKEKGIKKVVFDRGGFIFHGRVKAFADGARKAGLEF